MLRRFEEKTQVKLKLVELRKLPHFISASVK